MKSTVEIEIYYLTEDFDKHELGILFFQEGNALPFYKVYDFAEFWAFILNIPELEFISPDFEDYSCIESMFLDYRHWQTKRQWESLLKDLVEFVKITVPKGSINQY